MRDNNPVLEHFLHVMPVLVDLHAGEIGVAVTDREKYLFYRPSRKLDLKIAAGAPLKAGTAIVKAMEEKRRVVVRGDKVTFGLPYIATAFPIIDAAGGVVGGAVVIEPTDRQDALKEMAGKLSDNISVLASTTEEISAQAEEIATVSATLSRLSQESQLRVKETDQVIGLIKSIAARRTSWDSTPPSRPPAWATPAGVSASSPKRSANSPSAPPTPSKNRRHRKSHTDRQRQHLRTTRSCQRRHRPDRGRHRPRRRRGPAGRQHGPGA